MLRQVSKSLSSSDLWGAVTLAVFIGLIFTLALSTKASGENGYSLIVSSTPVADRSPLAPCSWVSEGLIRPIWLILPFIVLSDTYRP